MVYAEAGGEGKTGMALVARAILNRAGLIQSGKVGAGTFNAKSGSISDVIKAPIQFSPMGDGRINEKLSDSQINQAKDAITLAQKPSELMTALKSEGLDDASIKKLVASTGFRNKSVARYDASQDVNEVNYKRHTFNTAGNRALAVPQSVSISKEESPANMKGKGYGSTGSKLAGELGRYIDSKGLGKMGSGVHRHPEHPPYSLTSGHSSGSLHYQGRAVDIGGNTNEQGPVLAAVAEFNKLKGVKPVELFHGKNEPNDHWNHVHVAYEEGGPVNKTDYALTHPGEYVVDADSVKLFGRQFYDIINKTETISQRKNASDSLMSILSQYTEDGFPETEDDYSYQVSPPEVIMIPGPVIEIASSSYGGGGGGDEDPSQDGLEQR